MDVPVDLRHLRYFVAVAEELHFGRAAERLHMSQSPLSRATRELELELGLVLFIRTTRRVELTPAGAVLLDRGRRALDAVDAAVEEARRASLPHRGALSLGHGPSDADFEASLQLNFFAALHATRAAVAQMLVQGGGVVINVASVNSFYQPDGLTIDYGAAKAAMLNVAKSLSQELGPQGIRINSVSPGPVSTDLWLGDHGVASAIGEATGTDAATVRAGAISGMPSGRSPRPKRSPPSSCCSPRRGPAT